MSKAADGPEPDEKAPLRLKLVKTSDLHPEGELGACLRPLGLCELGGCCDVCWYGGGRREKEPPDSASTGSG